MILPPLVFPANSLPVPRVIFNLRINVIKILKLDLINNKIYVVILSLSLPSSSNLTETLDLGKVSVL
jgi:hypothetical protein